MIEEMSEEDQLVKLYMANPILISEKLRELFEKKILQKGGVCEIIGCTRSTLEYKLINHSWKLPDVDRLITTKIIFINV